MANVSRAFFFCVPSDGEYKEVPYQHLVVCLAEGLTALGIECYANIPYWPLDAERRTHLLTCNPEISPDDCDLVILSDEWLPFERRLPPRLFHASRRYRTIALDRQDGSRLVLLQPEFGGFDLVLRTHYNQYTRYPASYRPWAFGLSERIIRATGRAGEDGVARRHLLLANWRHTRYPHSLRRAVERHAFPKIADVLPVDEAREANEDAPIDPYERVLWYETGKRHWLSYYERLAESEACACFGGWFVTRWPASKSGRLSRTIKQIVTRMSLRTKLVSQWDSWRLWESLAAGCAAFHVDLALYGCVLPNMPQNWVHYIGIDLDDVDSAVERIRDTPGLLERVGAQGRAWALEQYAPKPTAQRLLDVLAAT